MNYILNKNLSLKAKGLLALLIELKESDIKISNETIKRFTDSGNGSINAAIKELKESGYLSIKIQSSGGLFRGANWFVYKDNYRDE